MQSNKFMTLALLSTGLLAHTAGAADLFNNGGFSTGATTGSGTALLPGMTAWSECQNDGAGTANTNSGIGATALTTRLADDFTVPAGPGWDIREIATFAYETGGTVQGLNGMTMQIWNGPPNVLGSLVVGGDLTNRLRNAKDTHIIRTFSTTVPAAALAQITRSVWEYRANMETSPGVALHLAPGTYWVDFSFTPNPLVTAPSAAFVPPCTPVGARNRPGDNALQTTTTGATWVAVIDAGNPAAGPDVTLDFPFIVRDTLTPNSCSSDINGDGVVNVTDLLAIITSWGNCP